MDFFPVVQQTLEKSRESTKRGTHAEKIEMAQGSMNAKEERIES